jgi:energy-coupling factor transporter ATP-binding protein EcfA2
MMKARIKNVLGVKSAEFSIEGITLIAGRNGAGKSSLVDALAAAALGEASARGHATKAGIAALLHEGTQAGSAGLDWGTGTQRVSYPGGKAESTGQAMTLGTPLGIGALRWMDLEPKRRPVEFAQRAGGMPTQKDLAEWLAANDGDAADAPGLWERIDMSGWDAVLKTAQEAATEKKGVWKHIAGTQFGEQKSKGWRPAVLLPDEDYTVEGAEADLAKARAELERMIAAGAMDRNRIVGLRPLADALARLQNEEAALRARIAEARATEGRLKKERGELMLGSKDIAFACPHCAGALDIRTSPAGGVASLVKSSRPAMTEAQAEEHQEALRLATLAGNQAQGLIDDLQADLVELVAKVNEAASADQEIKTLEATAAGVGKHDPKALAEQRLLTATLEERAAAVKAMIEAGAVYEAWARMQPMIKALAPDGVRAVTANRALAAWNVEMAAVSDAGGLGAVTLNDDLSLSLNGRNYLLLSESERWRCDAVMSMTLAKRELAAFVVLDRLDVLVPDSRAGVFKAAAALGIPTVIACSVKDHAATSLPHLRKAGLGSVWWMDAGTLTELPY